MAEHYEGTCAKCGRDFLTIPNDRRDHYPPERDHRRIRLAEPNENGECGGIVIANKPR